ncbi:MAG: hypothetical protein ACK4PR_04600 [Gammaproteobacteria bacterium]
MTRQKIANAIKTVEDLKPAALYNRINDSLALKKPSFELTQFTTFKQTQPTIKNDYFMFFSRPTTEKQTQIVKQKEESKLLPNSILHISCL